MLTKEVIEKYDAILSRGLCNGLGTIDGQMCIEAAVTQALNDKNWSSPQARAKGLRNLGIAQIGSAGIVEGEEFLQKLSTKIIQKMIPHLYRRLFKDERVLNLVLICEKEPTVENCKKLAAYAADAAADAAYAAVYAADAAAVNLDKDFYLIFVSNLALETLKELKSPGCEWL